MEARGKFIVALEALLKQTYLKLPVIVEIFYTLFVFGFGGSLTIIAVINLCTSSYSYLQKALSFFLGLQLNLRMNIELNI